MRKIIIIALSAVILCTVLAVSVIPATPYAVMRTCPYCNTRTMTVECGYYLTEWPDIECALINHTKPCVVVDRAVYSSLGTCSNVDCAYYYVSGARYRYMDHVETCKHSSTDDLVYYTCVF